MSQYRLGPANGLGIFNEPGVGSFKINNYLSKG